MEQNEKRQLFRHKLAQFEGWASLTVRAVFIMKLRILSLETPNFSRCADLGWGGDPPPPPPFRDPFVNLRPRRPGGVVAPRCTPFRYNRQTSEPLTRGPTHGRAKHEGFRGRCRNRSLIF